MDAYRKGITPELAAREQSRRDERRGTLHHADDLADRPTFRPRDAPPLPGVWLRFNLSSTYSMYIRFYVEL